MYDKEPHTVAPNDLEFSTEVTAMRPDDVRALAAAAGNFSASEIAVAVELVEARLQRGPASGYEFLFLDRDSVLLGYTCFGHIDGTDGRYDLYWIIVDPRRQQTGLGSQLLARSEELIRNRGGRKVYIETSSRDDYVKTRRFYDRNGYRLEARLEDFYADGDAKCIYVKTLAAEAPRP